MRLVEAYGNASSPTQRMVEGAVIERNRRRANILHSHVDDEGRPFDVDTDDEADEDIRRSLLEEGYIRIAAPAGQPQNRVWYARPDSTVPEVLRFVSPEPFVPPVVEEAPTEIVDAETSSDEEAAEEEREEQPMSTERRDALVAEVQRQIAEVRARQTPEERARDDEAWHRDAQEFMAAFQPPHDQPPAAAVVPQEGEQEPVWYYRRAREMALEDAERMQEPMLETTPPVPSRMEGRVRSAWPYTVRMAQHAARSNHHASSVSAHQSVRTEMKVLLHAVQEKLDEEIEASRNGQPFGEGSYVALVNLLRDTFRCVEQI